MWYIIAAIILAAGAVFITGMILWMINDKREDSPWEF